MPLCHASVEISFVTDAAAKNAKNAIYFAYNELPWGSHRDLHY